MANLSETEDKKLDVEKLSSAFTEINFQQHGHIVQLIVTPTTTTPGIKAALTIQVNKFSNVEFGILKYTLIKTIKMIKLLGDERNSRSADNSRKTR